MAKSKRKGYENHCQLPILVPKETVPLLCKLKEKIYGNFKYSDKAKGFILLKALKLMDQQTPYGFWFGAYGRLIPCDPPDNEHFDRPPLRLISSATPPTQEKGA